MYLFAWLFLGVATFSYRDGGVGGYFGAVFGYGAGKEVKLWGGRLLVGAIAVGLMVVEWGGCEDGIGLGNVGIQDSTGKFGWLGLSRHGV